jgi:hypothetical protein
MLNYACIYLYIQTTRAFDLYTNIKKTLQMSTQYGELDQSEKKDQRHFVNLWFGYTQAIKGSWNLMTQS